MLGTRTGAHGAAVDGRRRHVLVDTLGLLLRGIAHPASIQDRDGLAPLLTRIRRRFPWLQLLFGDGGYQGEVAVTAAREVRLGLTIVKRSDQAEVFVVRPRRWVVERSFAWFGPTGGWPRKGDPDRQRHRHALPRRHPPAHPPARNSSTSNNEFSDGLLRVGGGGEEGNLSERRRCARNQLVVFLGRWQPRFRQERGALTIWTASARHRYRRSGGGEGTSWEVRSVRRAPTQRPGYRVEGTSIVRGQAGRWGWGRGWGMRRQSGCAGGV